MPKPFKLTDGRGLYLEVRPAGSKLWRYRYRIAGKENVFAIGEYPEVTLQDARAERDRARLLVKQGVHPSHRRKVQRALRTIESSNSFEAVARAWLEHNTAAWALNTWLQKKRHLEADWFPFLGAIPVRDVTSAAIFERLKVVEKRAPVVAVLARQTVSQIFAFAITTLRAEVDPTLPLRRSLKPRSIKHKVPLAPADLPTFVKAIDDYRGLFETKAAIRLLLLTWARTIEVVGAPWSEFDLEKRLWTIPGERMKKRRTHVVPLSDQAIEVIKALRPITGKREFLFPNRDKPKQHAGKGLLWKAMASMGYHLRFSPHAIRTTASTIANEQGYRSDVIEAQLAHAEGNKTRRAYNQAQYLEERRVMMQAWADYLDGLMRGNVITGSFGKVA